MPTWELTPVLQGYCACITNELHFCGFPSMILSIVHKKSQLEHHMGETILL